MLKRVAILVMMVVLLGMTGVVSANEGAACDGNGSGLPPVCGSTLEGALGHNGDGTYALLGALGHNGDGTYALLGALGHNGDGTYVLLGARGHNGDGTYISLGARGHNGDDTY